MNSNKGKHTIAANAMAVQVHTKMNEYKWFDNALIPTLSLKLELILNNSELDKMITNINMFCASFRVSWCNCWLIIQMGYKRGLKVSLNKHGNQINSLAVWVAPIYSASIVDNVMSSCFFDDQDTAPPSTRTAKPETMHLSSGKI